MLLLWLWLGCAKRAVDGGDRVDLLIKAADAAWDARGMSELEASREPLDEAYALRRDHPQVLWRLIRYYQAVSLAETDPRSAQHALAEGRSIGMSCLNADPAFMMMRRSRGWREALDRVGDDRRSCVAWTALVWARWISWHGADAAALDVEGVTAFTEAAVASDDPSTRHTAAWAEALLMSTAPAWAGGDTERGIDAFGRTLRAAPADPVVLADRWAFVAPYATEEQRAAWWRELEAIAPATLDAAGALQAIGLPSAPATP